MSNQVELTAERVDHAVRAILDRKETPSVTAIQGELGGGDEAQINNLYQDWLDTHDNSVVPAEPEEMAMPATPEVPQRVVSVLDSLYDAVLQELEAQADRVRRERDTTTQRLVDEARTMRAEAEQTVAETDARLAAMLVDLTGLREEVATLAAANERLEAEVRTSKDSASAAREEVDRLTGDRDRLKIENDRLTSDRERLLADLAASTQRLDDAVAAREAALREAAALRGERDAYRRIVERDRIARGGRSPQPRPRRTPGK